MSNWHVGQRVVCVDADGLVPSYGDEILPAKGSVYTIRSITDAPGGIICFRLAEIVNPVRQYSEGYIEARFRARRFRPVVSDLTQFALLTSIVDRVGKRAKVRA